MSPKLIRWLLLSSLTGQCKWESWDTASQRETVPWRVAGPQVYNLEGSWGAMVPIRKAKLAPVPFPTAWQEKSFATHQTMSPTFCLCFSDPIFSWGSRNENQCWSIRLFLGVMNFLFVFICVRGGCRGQIRWGGWGLLFVQPPSVPNYQGLQQGWLDIPNDLWHF